MRITILSILLLNVFICKAQSLDELFKQSTQAYNNKQFDQFLTLMQKLDSMRPAHPRITYNLASAYALNKQTDNSIAVLKKLVLMNNTVKFENDSDFTSLKNSKAFNDLSLFKKELDKAIVGSEKVIELNEIDLHPEAILYLPKHKIWLATSIRKRKLISFDLKTGNCADWLTNGDLLAVFALKTDSAEQFLWIATSAIPEMIGYTTAVEGKAEILKIDIATKTIIERYPITGSHTFGDLIISKKGDVYISDSNEPIIYKLEKGQSEIKEWCNLDREAFNLQGLAFNENETQLFVADYLKGILCIDIDNAKNKNWLTFPEDNTIKGIDGISFYKGKLIAIHNGVTPIRIMQYELDQKKHTIIKSTIMDRARPEFMEPTSGCIYNKQFYFIANSPWSAYNKDMSFDAKKLKKPLLFKFNLK